MRTVVITDEDYNITDKYYKETWLDVSEDNIKKLIELLEDGDDEE